MGSSDNGETKATRGRVRTPKHFVRNARKAPFFVSRKLSECTRVLASLWPKRLISSTFYANHPLE
ncbi:MAG: hypothetical protein DME93_11890 [Verrucomicrobia bacterium]|nr:MAG: hypothetical protein DME93_11890 [Verrucomicrobiota bacterium]